MKDRLKKWFYMFKVVHQFNIFDWFIIYFFFVITIYLGSAIYFLTCKVVPIPRSIKWEQKYNILKSFVEDTGITDEEWLKKH